MAQSVWNLPEDGVNLAVLADCRLRTGGPALPDALLARLYGADLIVTLGNMGVRAGLDRLQELAPVLGVHGEDDEPDPRTRHPALVLEGEGRRIGCVADARAAGLLVGPAPYRPSAKARQLCERLFCGDVDILLHGGGPFDESDWGRAGTAIRPGSPLEQAQGGEATFLRLKITASGCYGQKIAVA